MLHLQNPQKYQSDTVTIIIKKLITTSKDINKNNRNYRNILLTTRDMGWYHYIFHLYISHLTLVLIWYHIFVLFYFVWLLFIALLRNSIPPEKIRYWKKQRESHPQKTTHIMWVYIGQKHRPEMDQRVWRVPSVQKNGTLHIIIEILNPEFLISWSIYLL